MFSNQGLWADICKRLPKCPSSSRHGIWTDGQEILCDNEVMAELIADFLEDLGFDYVKTGFYDPEEDHREGCVDSHTGFYYVDVD